MIVQDDIFDKLNLKRARERNESMAQSLEKIAAVIPSLCLYLRDEDMKPEVYKDVCKIISGMKGSLQKVNNGLVRNTVYAQAEQIKKLVKDGGSNGN
jgi:hypothetical protein